MNRREFIALLGGAMAWPCGTVAQVSTRRPLVAVLIGASSAASSRWVTGLPQRLQELGYVENRDLEIAYRYADGDMARMSTLADQLVRLKPDVVVAGNIPATLALRRVTAAIPIVCAALNDPVGLGLVASYPRPGGNVTGIMSSIDTLPEKQLALGAEVVPGAVRVGILVNVGNQAHTIQRQAAERAAAALSIKSIPVEVRSPGDLDAAFHSRTGERFDIVFILQDPMFLTERRRIATLAKVARLPTMYGLREHAEAGGLMSYGIDLRANFRRAADFVDKILKGSKPGDLPVELLTNFELVVNLNTAKAIGLTIPESFLLRADEVIE